MNNEILAKTINKENKNVHIVPLQGWVCKIARNCSHTPQGLVLMEGSNARIVWDGTTKREANDAGWSLVDELISWKGGATFVKLEYIIICWN